jgi:hypothetical protein
MATEEGSGPEHAAESRFAHLLKPIRDLAENWSVDIAHELEDYLHEVACRHLAIAEPRAPAGRLRGDWDAGDWRRLRTWSLSSRGSTRHSTLPRPPSLFKVPHASTARRWGLRACRAGVRVFSYTPHQQP